MKLLLRRGEPCLHWAAKVCDERNERLLGRNVDRRRYFLRGIVLSERKRNEENRLAKWISENVSFHQSII